MFAGALAALTLAALGGWADRCGKEAQGTD